MTRIDNQTKTFTLTFNKLCLQLEPKDYELIKAKTTYGRWAETVKEQLIQKTNLQLSKEWYLVKGWATEELGQITLTWQVRTKDHA